MAFVTAAAALEHFWSNGKFQASVRKKSETVTEHLDKLVENYPAAEMARRGRGMMQGIAFNDAELAGRIAPMAFQNGLIVETSGGRDEVIKLLPPLTIELEKLLAGLDVLEQAVVDATGQMNSNGKNRKRVSA
jgi:diaminobutyrate-2-oxoglutarate transaminase